MKAPIFRKNIRQSSEKIMRSYARNQGSQIPNTVIAQDVGANEKSVKDDATVANE